MEQVKLLSHHSFIQQLFAVVMTTMPPSSSATSAGQPKKGQHCNVVLCFDSE